jgi:hypothetical protein
MVFIVDSEDFGKNEFLIHLFVRLWQDEDEAFEGFESVVENDGGRLLVHILKHLFDYHFLVIEVLV